MAEDDAPYRGAQRTSLLPMSRLAPVHELVDNARAIAEADQSLGHKVNAKLELILEQIRFLQQQAADAVVQAREDMDLHRAKCNFHKRAGAVYHLYRRGEDELYFSMLHPDDWRGQPPHAYVGSFRLEPDLSWTRAEDVAARDARLDELRTMLPEGGLQPRRQVEGRNYMLPAPKPGPGPQHD
jgi:hypothetical protein